MVSKKQKEPRCENEIVEKKKITKRKQEKAVPTPKSPSPKAKLAKQKKLMFQVLADHYKTYHELMAAVPPK